MDMQLDFPWSSYADVRVCAGRLLLRAEALGGIGPALVEYLATHVCALPEGVTPETVVAEIQETVELFLRAQAEGRTAEDVRNVLREGVSKMDGHDAFLFLMGLEGLFRSCDMTAIGGTAATPAKLQETAQAELERLTPAELPGRIDAMAELVAGDSLKPLAMLGGNGALPRALDQAKLHPEKDPAAANRLASALTSSDERAAAYAAVACACYGEVLEGKLNGVTAADVPVRVLTTQIVAGLEKVDILARLGRGEINTELACSLLCGLGVVLKWMLVMTLMTLCIAGGMWVGGIIAIEVGAGFIGSAAIMTLGMVVGAIVSIFIPEVVEVACDALGTIGKAATGFFESALDWLFGTDEDKLPEAKPIESLDFVETIR